MPVKAGRVVSVVMESLVVRKAPTSFKLIASVETRSKNTKFTAGCLPLPGHVMEATLGDTRNAAIESQKTQMQA
uniref:Uncharacterized protein n=1 Tax=Oryza punctata TaxID=4537 RepID=A0A0E0KRL0_ORYPU